jgi:hypothetical protein
MIGAGVAPPSIAEGLGHPSRETTPRTIASRVRMMWESVLALPARFNGDLCHAPPTMAEVPVDFGEELTTRVAKPIGGIRPRPRRAHVLELLKGSGAPPHLELKLERIVIGRAENVDIVVDSEEVSRQHARFSRIDDEYQVEDLDSRNGVYLNGLKVHLAVLREGDEVQFGDLVFLYREGN